jgi:hypothetical protein
MPKKKSETEEYDKKPKMKRRNIFDQADVGQVRSIVWLQKRWLM